MPREHLIRPWLSLVASLVLLFAAAWTVLPGPIAVLLPLAVGAPELSAWLVVIAVPIGLTAALDARRRRAGAIALGVSVVCAALALAPLIQAGRATRRFALTMSDVLGEDYLRDVTPEARAGMRRRPIQVVDLFRGFDPGGRAPTAAVLFGSPDGQPLRMDVYTPPSGGPHPALVQIYGGAWQRGHPGNNASSARYFAARGYVVFALDYRHAPQWRWPAQIDDVRTGLAWVQKHGADYGADVSRIALVGRSAGAHLALLAAYMPGGPPVRAVVSYYGPTDLVGGYREPPRPDPLDVRAILETFTGGTPDTAPAAYHDGSPLTYAGRPQPPTLLIYGSRDHVVSPHFGATLHARLRAAGTTSVLLELPWAEHAFDAIPFGPGAQLSLYHTERFLAWATQRKSER